MNGGSGCYQEKEKIFVRGKKKERLGSWFNLPTELPDLVTDGLEEPAEELDAVLRNFLLIFTALNRFGCGATGVKVEFEDGIEPKGTREGRGGGVCGRVSVGVCVEGFSSF